MYIGSVATAVGACIMKIMLDGESEGDSSHEDEDGQEAIESQDDTASPEQPA